MTDQNLRIRFTTRTTAIWGAVVLMFVLATGCQVLLFRGPRIINVDFRNWTQHLPLFLFVIIGPATCALLVSAGFLLWAYRDDENKFRYEWAELLLMLWTVSSYAGFSIAAKIFGT